MYFTSSSSNNIYLVYLLRDQRLPLSTLENKTKGCTDHMKGTQCETKVKLDAYLAPSLSNRGSLEKLETPQIWTWSKEMDFHVLYIELHCHKRGLWSSAFKNDWTYVLIRSIRKMFIIQGCKVQGEVACWSSNSPVAGFQVRTISKQPDLHSWFFFFFPSNSSSSWYLFRSFWYLW